MWPSMGTDGRRVTELVATSVPTDNHPVDTISGVLVGQACAPGHAQQQQSPGGKAQLRAALW